MGQETLVIMLFDLGDVFDYANYHNRLWLECIFDCLSLRLPYLNVVLHI